MFDKFKNYEFFIQNKFSLHDCKQFSSTLSVLLHLSMECSTRGFICKLLNVHLHQKLRKITDSHLKIIKKGSVVKQNHHKLLLCLFSITFFVAQTHAVVNFITATKL